MALEPWWSNHDVSWVAISATDTLDLLVDHPVRWTNELRAGDSFGLVRETAAAIRHLQQQRPQLVLSAGTGIAVPYFIAARLLGIRSWWLQTLNVGQDTGLASQLCERLATRVLVQRPELLAQHRRSAYLGELY